jgi:PAS domain S-box-containing protein
MTSAPYVHTAEGRSARFYLSAAVLLTLTIFVMDLWIPPGTGIAALYGVPLLIASHAGSARLHISAAWLVSLLIVVAVLRIPFAQLPGVVVFNRLVALGVVWTSVSIVVRLREATRRLQARTRDLADTQYALDQSAIVATTNTKGTITYVNDKFCEISKYSREELLGQDHRIVNSGYHPKEFIRSLWHTIANGHIWRGEIRNRAKDGSFYWVDTTIVPFLDARGKPYQYMAIRYEITDRKRSEEILREKAALTRLGEMAAVVAHEVKNPIAGIRGALQVIASRLPADQRDRLIMGDIINRLDALNGIVQDLLLYSRPRQLKREQVDVTRLIDNTGELLRRDPALSGTKMQIDGNLDPVSADPEQLRIALQNLLMNAAQAMSGQGTIDVTLTSDAGTCRIGIRDYGPGMPDEVRAKAFDAFFTTKHRGTGLGLPIARRIIEAHNGQIDIAPADGAGTLVSVELPIRNQAH